MAILRKTVNSFYYMQQRICPHKATFIREGGFVLKA